MRSLEVRGLRHAFSAGRKRKPIESAVTRVLDDVSFEVRAGEVFGLLGPNGCGKSTTLRVLCGLLVPDAGEILLDGERVEPGGRELRARIGVVFQSPSVDARLTVRENLTLAAALQRLSGEL
ncbi:MAG TPA: ATP-binding cassette domain-containing protein, partial [Polyangiales bacterium]|nr:ATP-binding cassette domain-containing protein [Polyangiales bacterium]